MKREQKLLILASLAFRIFCAFFCESYYVADEYWQSLEVAHKLVFGYGQLTWEWRQGIRSFILPTIFAIPYSLLSLLHLDTPFLLQNLPKILMALLTSYEDYLILKHFGYKSMLIFLSMWPSSYFGTRSLIDTFESFYFLLCRIHGTSIPLAIIAFWMRPTSIFCSLYFLNYKSIKKSHFLIGLLTTISLNLSDLLFYHFLNNTHPLFTPIRFLHFNFTKGISTYYGSQPFFFYFYSVLPSLLGPLICALPLTKDLYFPVLQILFLSISAHKEIRYLYSLVPILAILASRRTKTWFLYFNAGIHLILLLFLARFHQIGQTQVIKYVTRYPKPTLFLLDCHSTPLTAWVHSNVTLRILECPYSGYAPAKHFLQNPREFVQGKSPLERVVTYSSFLPEIGDWLANYSMVEVKRYFNSFFHVDGINNSYLSVFERDTSNHVN